MPVSSYSVQSTNPSSDSSVIPVSGFAGSTSSPPGVRASLGTADGAGFASGFGSGIGGGFTGFGVTTSVFATSASAFGAASALSARAISSCSSTFSLAGVSRRTPSRRPGRPYGFCAVAHASRTTPSPCSAGVPPTRSIENAVSSPIGRIASVEMNTELASQNRWKIEMNWSRDVQRVAIRSPRVFCTSVAIPVCPF